MPESQLESAHDPFNDIVDLDRKLAHGACGDGTAAWLVAREACTVEQQDGCAGGCEPVRACRSGRPGPDDDRVVGRHAYRRSHPSARPQARIAWIVHPAAANSRMRSTRAAMSAVRVTFSQPSREGDVLGRDQRPPDVELDLRMCK